MKKYIFILFLIAANLLILSAPALALDSPDSSAKAVYIVNESTGDVFISKSENLKVEPSVISKVMTVLLAVEACERGDVAPSDVVTASYTSHNDLTADCRTQNIIPSEKMPLEDLMYCAIVSSANEACNIIGEYITDENIDDFIKLMNSRAAELGCTSTVFKNAHGLPVAGQYTTAHDAYLIAQEAMSHPLFAKICNTTSKELAPTNISDIRYITTTNYILSSNYSRYFYAYASGVKAGGTDADGYSLITNVNKDGINLCCVVLGVPSGLTVDGEILFNNFTESRSLCEWIFANYAYTDVISTDTAVREIPVKFGTDRDFVVVVPQSSINLLLPSDVETSDFEQSVSIYDTDSSGAIKAPISAGDVLGELTLSRGGTDVGTVKLVALTDVEASSFDAALSTVTDLLTSPILKYVLLIALLCAAAYIVFVIIYNSQRKKRNVYNSKRTPRRK